MKFLSLLKYAIVISLLFGQTELISQSAKVDISFDKITAEDIYNRGARALRNDNYAAAMIYFDRVLRMDSEFARAYNKRGLIFYKKEKYDAALTTLNLTKL